MASSFVMYMFCSLFSLTVLAANIEDELQVAAGNTTVLNTVIAPGWASSPTFRGTADILWSCVVTLVACIYTALHLNIPQNHESSWRRLGRKVKWAVIALLAPELVVHTAWRQYREASRLCKTLNQLHNSQDTSTNAAKLPNESPIPSQHDPFSLEYGFWVVMGGFVADTSPIHDHISRITLTTHGVELLAREGHFLEISTGAIADRSKANVLAKSLICAQVGWMVLQCIARKTAGYPITILEIHTMVHVVCAFCIYSLWWHKPLDVQEAEPVDVSAHQDLLALMLMASTKGQGPDSIGMLQPHQDSRNPSYRLLLSNTIGLPFLRTDVLDPLVEKTPCDEQYDVESQTKPVIVQHSTLDGKLSRWYTNTNDKGIINVRSGQSLANGLGPRIFRDRHPVGLNMSLSAKDVYRWDLAAQSLKKLESTHRPYPREYYASWSWANTRYSGCDKSVAIFTPNMTSNWSSRRRFGLDTGNFIWTFFGDKLLLSFAFVLPIIYAGIHLSAWNFDFPTRQESLLWKIACFIILAMVPASYISMQLSFWCPEFVYDAHAFMFLLAWLVYVASRLYIVVEAFLSLRHVPLGVYAIPNWVQSIPHI